MHPPIPRIVNPPITARTITQGLVRPTGRTGRGGGGGGGGGCQELTPRTLRLLRRFVPAPQENPMSIPIGDPRPAGEAGPAGDLRAAGEEGPAGDPRQPGQATLKGKHSASFDPADHTVAEVKAQLDQADDAERYRILAAEKAGKARASIIG